MVVSDSSIPTAALLFSSSSLNVHRAYPGGGSLQLNTIIFASMATLIKSGKRGILEKCKNK
jgi:hypothetical protein